MSHANFVLFQVALTCKLTLSWVSACILHGTTILKAYCSIGLQWNNRHSEEWIREGEFTGKTIGTSPGHVLREVNPQTKRSERGG